MKPIDKLTKTLCTVPAIKEDIMELKFGTKLLDLESMNKGVYLKEDDQCLFDGLTCDFFDEFITIGNPIQERHLRMYCEENDIQCSFSRCLVIRGGLISGYDNKLDFNLQDDSVIEKINTFLENQKGEK